MRRGTIFSLVLVACGGTTTEDAGSTPDVGAGSDAGATSCEGAADCDDHSFCNGEETCDPSSLAANERGCAPGTPPCAIGDLCIERADACMPPCDVADDFDGDGAISEACGGDDCDDTNADVRPQAIDLCDAAGVDHDCDASTPGHRDIDDDGHDDARCTNVEADVRGSDCNDFDPNVHDGAAEICNGRDDDCDGTIDDGVTVAGFLDADGDGAGDPARPMEACPTSGRFASNGDDCDDGDLTVRRGRVEICDRVDNDCDLTIDEDPQAVAWYVDGDGDGFGAARSMVVVSCRPVAGRSLLGTDCDDVMAPSVHPGQAEICNGVDDDCNGELDGRTPEGDLEDDDGDGHADDRCVGFGGDCDDLNGLAARDAPEICENGIDDDCDPSTLDDDTSTPFEWYPDLDGDGWGDASAAPTLDCHYVADHTFRTNDCNDLDATLSPLRPDRCGRGDEDCDGEIDENARLRAVFADADLDDVGVDAMSIVTCEEPPPPGYAESTRDCAPSDPTRAILYPDADGDGVGDLGAEPVTTCTTGSFAETARDCNDRDSTVSTADGCIDPCDGDDDDRDGMIDEDLGAGCPNAIGTTWACSSGSCTFGGCLSGFDNCDRDEANGCENDLRSDPDNCGSCAIACDLVEACTASVCDDPFVDIGLLDHTSMALRRSGNGIVWGGNCNGYAADGVSRRCATGTYPPYANLLVGASQLHTAPGHRGCARFGSEWRCWGRGWRGGSSYSPILDHGSNAAGDIEIPTALTFPDIDVLGIGVEHSCAITSTDRVMCWGYGFSGELGDGLGSGEISTPVQMLGVTDAVAIGLGATHTCVVRAGGGVVCTGANGYGQLGEGTTARHNAPTDWVILESTGMPLAGALDVVLSNETSCARLASGEVACWGRNDFGQLGAGRPEAMLSRAVLVADPATPGTSLRGVTELRAGGQFFCAIASGQLVCWGQNTSGQLGDPSLANHRSPRVLAIEPFRAWDLGGSHMCVIPNDGLRVLCWGDGSRYQLGVSSTADSATPIEVMGLRRGAP